MDSFGAQKPKEQSIPGKRSLVPTIQGTVSLEVSRGGWEGAEHEEKQEADRVAQGVSGPSSSGVWNPRVFADDVLELRLQCGVAHEV